MKQFLRWLFDSYLRAGVILVTILAVSGASFAAVSVDWNNLPQMYLDASITGTQTSNIVIATPQINGGNWVFSTTSGGVLRIRSGAIREDVHYTSASVNSSTLKVTLSGVTRHVCENVSRQYRSCGDGYSFPKGAIVEYSVDSRNINLKANLDRANTFTATQSFASGATFTGTTHALRVSQVTTAQRDAIASPANGMIVYNTTTGVLNQYVGGSWVAVGSDTTTNATESASGKAEAATVADQLARAAAGDSSALLFLQAKYLTSSGGTTLANGRLAIMSGSVLDESVLGTGSASGKYLRSYLGNPTWTDVIKSLRLSNSGSLTVNSFATGALVDVKQTNTSYFVVEGSVKNGHLRTGGSAPTFSPECSMSDSGGNDTAGFFTVSGAEERCSMYFNKIFTNPPACFASYPSQTDTSVLRVATTSTGMIVSEQGDSNFNTVRISYICLGY